jgi:acylphosphatase
MTGPMDDPGIRRVRVRASGRVQGVFYRASCAEAARARGVRGWVRNAPDGAVEAAFEGAAAEVEALVGWCRAGPPLARVDALEVSEEAPVGEVGFRIRG